MVTGGAGFIGSHVVDRYIEEGHDVIVVDDLSTGFRENVNERARFHELDIRDERVMELIRDERPDVINHHAAQMDVRKAVEDPFYDADVNIHGTLNLLEACKECSVDKVIYISTGGAVFGEVTKIPVPEDEAINPLSPYGITKHTVEHYLFAYRANFGLNYTVLRYPNVYGPRQNPHGEAGVVAIFTLQMSSGIQPTIYGDGTKTRDYVYISDVVEANRLALRNGDGEIYNLGWGKEVSDFQIFDGVRKGLDLAVEPRYDAVRSGEIGRICLDGSKIKRALGWEPKVSLQEGIRRTIEYFNENASRQEE